MTELYINFSTQNEINMDATDMNNNEINDTEMDNTSKIIYNIINYSTTILFCGADVNFQYEVKICIDNINKKIEYIQPHFIKFIGDLKIDYYPIDRYIKICHRTIYLFEIKIKSHANIITKKYNINFKNDIFCDSVKEQLLKLFYDTWMSKSKHHTNTLRNKCLHTIDGVLKHNTNALYLQNDVNNIHPHIINDILCTENSLYEKYILDF